jgi:hypothetical protein
MILSSGVMWTTQVKQALLEWHEFVLIDAMGSTEGGAHPSWIRNAFDS